MSIVNEQETGGREGGLVTRLDSAIGEASTGIGILLSELVRRSLRAGVADIDQTIHTFAHEQVTVAIDRKLPEITEVAESTSRRITESAVQKVTEIAQQATETMSQSLNTAVCRLEGEIGETKLLSDQTGKTLEEVREKAKNSGKKVRAAIERLRNANKILKQGLLDAREFVRHSRVEVEAELARLRESESQLQSELAASRDRESAMRVNLTSAQDELVKGQQQLESLVTQVTGLVARVAELERPKGLNALFQKLTGRGKPTQG